MKKSPNLSVGLVFDDSLDSSDGVAQYVKTLGSWLSRQGHDVSYLVGQTKLTEWSGAPVYSLSRNAKVVFNGNRLSIPLPTSKAKLKKLVESKNFDVIHVMMPHSPFMAQKIVDLAGGKTAVVGTFHVYPSGWLARAGGRLLRIWYGRKLNRFDQIVSVSLAAAEYAASVFKIDSQVVPNPVDISRFRPLSKVVQTDKIVFLGRLVPRKGCGLLLQAFSQMKNRSAQLVIAGAGPQQTSLRNAAMRLKIADRVQFMGYIDEKDKPRLLAGARIACFPSLHGESFGIVLIEAMAAGAGVVLGGDNPGYRSVLGGQPDLLINPRDVSAFAERLDNLLEQNEHTADLHAWQDQAVVRYDIKRVGAELVDIYRRQIARRTKKSNN